MKKFLTLFLCLILGVCTIGLVACGKKDTGDGDTPPPFDPAKLTYDMSGASWDYSTAFTYDGEEKSVVLTNLPDGVTVKTYTDNTKVDAGTYTAKATFNYDTENYNAPEMPTCSWTINKAEITGVTIAENQSAKHDGNKHLPTISGVPSGVNVKYYLNNSETTGASALGTHAFTIVLSGKNYVEKTLTCAFKITLNVSTLVSTVFDSFANVPDPWGFLPESFATENRTLRSTPTYTNFTNVSSIPTNGIGKQLNVAYGLLNKAEVAIGSVEKVYAVMNTIKSLYSTFLDNNPENYKSFSSTTAGITFTLNVGETEYTLSATVGNVEVVISSDTKENKSSAKIQLAKNTILKYEVCENSLLIALDVLNSVAVQIEFVREDDKVLGYMYEFLTLNDKTVTSTSTLIHVGDKYTTLIGTKGDFILTAESRNCEVYLNSTGELVGTEVREELDIVLGTATYNTLWYTLNDVLGINSIKKVDQSNGLNADTIYINGASSAIHSKTVSILPTSNKAYSRRFDIEFKEMYFYTYNSQTKEYEEVVCEIPMLFVQEENADTLIEDFSNANSSYLSGEISLLTPSADKNAVNYGYYTLLQAYDLIKDLITAEDIKNFCKA